MRLETSDKFMRRLALIFGILLTLTAGVWGGALATVSSCLHEANTTVAATATAPEEHDCCRARLGESKAHQATAPEGSHEATYENPVPQNQAGESHQNVDCIGSAETGRESNATALDARGTSCVECCAGRSGGTPTTAVVVAPEQHQMKRDRGRASMSARELYATAESAGVSPLAPSQHAPPPTEQRRHVLISVFLI